MSVSVLEHNRRPLMISFSSVAPTMDMVEKILLTRETDLEFYAGADYQLIFCKNPRIINPNWRNNIASRLCHRPVYGDCIIMTQKALWRQ